MNLTVKIILDPERHQELVLACDSVRFVDSKYKEQWPGDYTPGLYLISDDDHRATAHFPCGEFFVMNDRGKTVARYFLGWPPQALAGELKNADGSKMLVPEGQLDDEAEILEKNATETGKAAVADSPSLWGQGMSVAEAQERWSELSKEQRKAVDLAIPSTKA